MFKNTASQKVTLLAIDTAANVPKTGDAANITAYVSKDDGAVTVLTDTSATELDATNAPGLYSFDLSQAETNGDKLLFSAKSSTSGIKIVPQVIYTHPTGGIASPTNITAGTIATVTNGVTLAAGAIVTASFGTCVPPAPSGMSTLTQAQVTGGAYALNSASFAFNAALDFTTTQKAATLARMTLVDTTTNVTNTPTFNGPSAATIADAVLDEALAGHLTLGSFGYYVAETHATGDLSYLIVSDGINGNAAIKTYLTTNVGLLGVNLTAADDAVITAIGALNNLSQANVRTAVGLATANLDTQLADLPTVAEFEARTILAAAYGTAANQSAIVGYIDTEVAAILAAVDTEVGAIKAKTDQLTFTVANQVDSNALSGGGSGLDAAGVRTAIGLATANLDAQLADIPTVAEFNARTLLAAAYFDPAVDIVTTTDTTNITAILADTNELQGDWVNGGRLDLILDTIASNVAAILADTGTDGVALSAALCNKVADHVRRRTQANVEASSDGDTLSLGSEYGFIQQAQESNTTDTAGLLTVKKTDGTTTLGTKTIASDAAADPITGIS